jgi:hypothetical protein
MRRRWKPVLIAAIAILYWEVVARVLKVQEPWDSPSFLPAYLLALGGCGVIAFFLPERAWRWGIIASFAQLPVMLAHSDSDGSLLPAGLLFLAALSLPAIAVAIAIAALRRRWGQAKR